MTTLLAAASDHVGLVLLELGLVVLALAVVGRLADRLTLSPIPFYLLAGLGVGEGGVVQIDVSEEFIEIGSEIGVVLLLLALGVEYSAEELRSGLRQGWRAGVVDGITNFMPGFVAALVLGWGLKAALVLGGVTYISSSGVIAKVLTDLNRLGNRETPAVLTVLVIEDLAMAVYLPVLAVVLAGGGVASGFVSVTVALVTVMIVLVLALRHGTLISRVLSTRSDELLLLSVVGLTLVVAGVAQRLQVSAAVGAFLVGVAMSGSVSERVSRLVGPLRDLFAATFFFFFALQVDPGRLPGALAVAGTLAVATAATKVVTGWSAAAWLGVGRRGRARAGAALVARGEFSIVIAGLGAAAGVRSEVDAVAAAYVLLLAIAGPILMRYADVAVQGDSRARSRRSDHPI
ncbi:MAG TPA: cation:proton antiporter [Acidimicrobiia bacterium]|nr:cation:proton antiporter [Acidimicrobiia bacterium]